MEVTKKQNILVRLIDSIDSVITGVVLLAIFVDIILQVATRILPWRAFAWTNEVGEILLSVLIWIGLSAAVKSNNHIGFDMFVSRLSPSRRRWFNIINTGMFIIYLALLGFLTWKMMQPYLRRNTITPMLGINMYYVRMPILIGCVMGAIRLAIKEWRALVLAVPVLVILYFLPYDSLVLPTTSSYPVMTLTLVVIAGALIFIGSPMAMALGLSAIFVVVFFKPSPTAQIVPRLLSEASTYFVLLAVPLFILVGNLMARGTVGRNLIDFTTSLVGWMPGGLGAVNIVGSMLFGGISGSSLADTATFGTILVPTMEANGYPRDYAGAVTLTSSSLSVVIPPSLLLVLAAATTEQSVGKALAGGLLPGILLTIMLLIPNHIICVRNNYGHHIPFSWSNVWEKFKTCWSAIIAPVIVLGSIFTGWVTPTEGAAIAVLYVLFIDFVLFRKLSVGDVWHALKDAGILTAAILFIATSSAVANWIVATEQIPDYMARVLVGMPGGKHGFLLMIVLMVIAIGMVVDATPATLIFTPLFLPIAMKMGVNSTHFLVLIVVGLALGLTTPPYGVCLFSISTVCKIPMEALVKRSWPFYVFMLVTLMFVTFIPEISTFVPDLLGL